jgi:hypothetical protein
MAFTGLDAEGSRDHLPVGNPMQLLNEENNTMPAFQSTTPTVKLFDQNQQNNGANLVSSSQPMVMQGFS